MNKFFAAYLLSTLKVAIYIAILTRVEELLKNKWVCMTLLRSVLLSLQRRVSTDIDQATVARESAKRKAIRKEVRRVGSRKTGGEKEVTPFVKMSEGECDKIVGLVSTGYNYIISSEGSLKDFVEEYRQIVNGRCVSINLSTEVGRFPGTGYFPENRVFFACAVWRIVFVVLAFRRVFGICGERALQKSGVAIRKEYVRSRKMVFRRELFVANMRCESLSWDGAVEVSEAVLKDSGIVCKCSFVTETLKIGSSGRLEVVAHKSEWTREELRAVEHLEKEIASGF